MKVYMCDWCNKYIVSHFNEKPKLFYYILHSYFVIPFRFKIKRKKRLRVCDDCYSYLNSITEKKENGK